MGYPSSAETHVIEAAQKLMKETMARYDPSHDALHVERVRRAALHIATQVAPSHPEGKPDLLTVELAALLHDVLDKKYVSEAEAADPYTFFLPFFEKARDQHGLDLIQDGRAREIAKIVTNVSWSTEKKLRQAGLIEDWHRECVELHCVQDGDRLDAIGAFGILRCAAYSASVNRPLHVPEGQPGQDTSAIQHFYDKLLHIREQLKTEPGKKMAEHRHELMLDFLSAVDDEFAMKS